MGYISNNQSFNSSASGLISSTTVSQFRNVIDSVMIGMGRNITIHLPPTKQQCPDVSCSFNPFYKKFTRNDGKICDSCKGQGFLIEPRYTVYIANMRWTNESLNESSNIQERYEIGRVKQNLLRVKTVASSMSHIRESIGATVDGINLELSEEPRYTGLGGTLLYVVSLWKAMNR